MHYLDCFHTLLGKFTKLFEQFFHVISIRKSESREHYQPSAFGLGLAKFSLGSLFVILITWKIFSHTFKFFYESGNRKNNATKYNFLHFSSIFRRKIELSKIFFHTFPGLGTNFSGLSLAELRSANERPEKLVPRSGKIFFPLLGTNFSSLSLVEE